MRSDNQVKGEDCKDIELEYRTRIIKLEKELEYETNRANDYQIKFKEAVLQSQYSSEQSALEKLNEKENELNQARMMILQLNRKILTSADSNVETLTRKNEQLLCSFQEIKNAAISAIMVKQEEIQQLQVKLKQSEVVQAEYKQHCEKYEAFEKAHKDMMVDYEEQIRQLGDKLSKQRDNFLSRLQALQKQVHNEENIKQCLLEKAQSLQGNLQESELMIQNYENRLREYESCISKQRLQFQQQTSKLSIEIERLKESMIHNDKLQRNLIKMNDQLRTKEKEMKQQLEHYKEVNEELERKLVIKRRKENKDISDRIYSSFAEKLPKNNAFASFGGGQVQGDMPYEKMNFKKGEKLANVIEGDQAEGFENFEFEDIQMMPKGEDVTKGPARKNSGKDNDWYCEAISKLQKQKVALQTGLKGAYNQIEQLNGLIRKMTTQLHTQRKISADLREKMKKSTRQSQLTVNLQSLRQHAFKLENALLIEKLNNAERNEFAKEKYDNQKEAWTATFMQLTNQIKKLQGEIKKKKKGFFG